MIFSWENLFCDFDTYMYVVCQRDFIWKPAITEFEWYRRRRRPSLIGNVLKYIKRASLKSFETNNRNDIPKINQVCRIHVCFCLGKGSAIMLIVRFERWVSRSSHPFPWQSIAICSDPQSFGVCAPPTRSLIYHRQLGVLGVSIKISGTECYWWCSSSASTLW